MLGVFFLFGAGRLALCRSQPQRAIEFYTQAMESQQQYRNLHHISFWEIAIANLALWDLPASLKCWRELEAEATVRSFVMRLSFVMKLNMSPVVEGDLFIWNGRLPSRTQCE